MTPVPEGYFEHLSDLRGQKRKFATPAQVASSGPTMTSTSASATASAAASSDTAAAAETIRAAAVGDNPLGGVTKEAGGSNTSGQNGTQDYQHDGEEDANRSSRARHEEPETREMRQPRFQEDISMHNIATDGERH